MGGGRLSIGDMARAGGCTVQTIRYYETIDLLPPAERSEGGQRRYTGGDRRRLTFVRHCRELGFALGAIRELLALADSPERPCADADRIAKRQLAEVEGRLARLEELRRELARMVTECRGGRVADCRVIEVLADHRLCLGDHVS